MAFGIGRPEENPEEQPKKEEGDISKRELLEMMTALVQEMKKPSAVEQKKIDEEAAEKQRTRSMMLEQAQMDMQAKTVVRGMCNHRKNEGRDEKYSVGGQINSDGKLHALCTRCQMELAVVSVPMELRGVTFDSDLITQILLPTGALNPKPLDEVRRMQVAINSKGKVISSEEGEIAASLSS